MGVHTKGKRRRYYRNTRAKRAKIAGHPERFAQLALGHKSRAVHRACAETAVLLATAVRLVEDQAPYPSSGASRAIREGAAGRR